METTIMGYIGIILGLCWVCLLALGREEGNMLDRDYIRIILPYSVLRTNKLSGLGV